MLILVVVAIMFIAYYVDRQVGLKKGENRSPLFGAYIIISESMIPSINVYDAVLTIRASEDDIEKYDIITFISKEIETAGTPITHRVIDIVHDPEDENKIIGYRTKGDHNNTADFALIAPNEVIGKVYLRIPMIGYLQTFMTKPLGWILIIVVPCLLIIGSDVMKLFKSSNDNKNKSKDVEEKRVREDNSSISTISNSLEEENKYLENEVESLEHISDVKVDNKSNNESIFYDDSDDIL